MNFRFKKAELGVFKNTPEEAISGFGKNCRIMGLTRGQFSLIDLIHSVLKKTGSADVICTTWSAGIKDAHQIKWLLDSDLINSFSLITDHSYATRQKRYVIAIEDLFGKENIRTSEIHAKFTLISNEDYKVCIRTSMNLNANRTCENFEIDEDEEVFNFYMEFIDHTFGFMDEGFVKESWKVNKSLDDFFNRKSKNENLFFSDE